MPDDLDNLIRAAMKTLDEQVPSGYFEALPNQTLARLEGSSMQQGSSGTTTRAADKVGHALPAPVTLEPDTAPVAKQPSQNPDERDEDSGLHDIRNLAQSTKQRLSKRSITQNPPIADDVLASSSGSFKNIALPQPARMVSLPEVADVREIEKAARAPKKTKEPSEKKKKEEVVAPVAIAETNLTAMPAAPEVQAQAAQALGRSQFTLPSQQNKRSKGPLIALVGTGLAAAAGYVIFLQVQKSEDTTAASPSMAAEQTAAPQAAPAVTTGAAGSAAAVTAQPIEEPAPAEAPKVDEGAAGAGAQIAADDNMAAKDAEASKEEKADKPSDKKKPTRTKGGKNKVEKQEEPEPPPAKKVEVKPETKAEVKKPAGKGEEGEPSFDALLKEAGVDEKKEVKPKLEKKSLTGDDFKKGMASVAGKAKGCYKGTQGTAMVKLTVAPSGQVSKVSVGGDFAGKPEGSCVESAIKSASFPPWDGGPMSFTYSVLLAD